VNTDACYLRGQRRCGEPRPATGDGRQPDEWPTSGATYDEATTYGGRRLSTTTTCDCTGRAASAYRASASKPLERAPMAGRLRLRSRC